MLKSYDVTYWERIKVRTQISAASPEEAETLAFRKFHADCTIALEAMDTPSEVLEFEGADFFEVEEAES